MRKVLTGLFILCAGILSGQINSSIQTTVHDTISDTYGFINYKGELVIPFGKYTYVYTDTLDKFAFVRDTNWKLLAIKSDDTVLFEVFEFDNGPDYPSEGLFRIISNGKIGFADEQTFEIVIQPQFECARAFKNGRAEVSYSCTRSFRNEYEYWESEAWIFIDKHENKIDIDDIGSE